MLWLFVSLALAQTLIVAPREVPAGLDAMDSRGAFHVSTQIAETLVGFIPGTATPTAGLATGWWGNHDATVWTFDLRPGVTFHDGSPFNAEAVVFNVERWNHTDHPYAFRDQGKTYSAWAMLFGGTRGNGGILERVEALGEHQIAFYLTRPTATLPLLLGTAYTQMNSPAAIMMAGVDYGTVMVGAVGTGPFIFERWVDGESIHLRAHTEYWGGEPKVERVVFRFITDSSARYLALQAGAIDVAAGLPIAEFPAIVANPDLVHTLVDELNISWLGINQGHPPLDQLLVRQAIAHAIDRQALLDAFLSDLGVLAQGFVHPSLERAPRSWPFDFDPQRARALLLEAGFPDGFDITLWHRPNTHATMPAPRAAAEAVASYLADIGIRVRIETTDSSAYSSLRRQGDFALFQGTWTADFADADSFLGILFGSFVGSELGWDDPAVADALERARGSADVVEREQLYQGVEERIALAVAAIPMAHGRALHGHRSNIENWIGSPLGFWWAPLHDVVKR